MHRTLVVTGLAAVIAGCSSPRHAEQQAAGHRESGPGPGVSRPAALVPLAGVRGLPDVSRGVDGLAAIPAGQPVTLAVRDLRLHLRPGGQSYFTYGADPWDLANPCGSALCYRTPSGQLTNHGQVGNCWIETGPPVNVVTITSAQPCLP